MVVPTALLSVYDKTGIVDVARSLADLGWSLVSSGGTARVIADAGVAVTDLAELTQVPPILSHRVVTLHPVIHGGILADPTNPEHVADMERFGITPFDLVIGNLYPFGADPADFAHGSGSPVELIDIGGPAMLRAAAKNFAHLGVVVEPDDYAPVLDELREHNELSASTRKRLARAAFAHTAAYDAAIVAWFDGDDTTDELPDKLDLTLVKAQPLRYGENPHQQGARYREVGATSWWDSMTQHGGKALSFLNLFDTEAAWRLVHRFEDPACVVVKHANPCGVAISDTIDQAYRLAHECDPVSAFGGIVAANGEVDNDLALALAEVFTEVIVAPGYSPEALDTLTSKKNLRVITAPRPSPIEFDVRPIDGGLLVQQPDPVAPRSAAWRVVTEAQPSDEQWRDMQFAWTVCAAVSSNAIVYTKDQQAVGIGAGQQNRLDAARIAAERANGRAAGGACASDAFFPFRDGLDAAFDAGVSCVIQPGGSVRDDEVIAAANEHGLVMVFTGERHFRH